MLWARSKGLPFTRRPIIVKCPLAKRKALSRVVVKENRRSVQWWTLRTRSSRKALMVLWKIGKVEKPAGGQARSRPLRRPVWPSAAPLFRIRACGKPKTPLQARSACATFALNVVTATSKLSKCYTACAGPASPGAQAMDAAMRQWKLGRHDDRTYQDRWACRHGTAAAGTAAGVGPAWQRRQAPVPCLSGAVPNRARPRRGLRPLCQPGRCAGAARPPGGAAQNPGWGGGRWVVVGKSWVGGGPPLVPLAPGGAGAGAAGGADASADTAAPWSGDLLHADEVFVTGVGASTTYPDYKPAPFIVRSPVQGGDMVTVVTEGIFSYCSFKVKIDTDRFLGPEQAPVRCQGEAVGHVTTAEYGSQMLSLGGGEALTRRRREQGRP